MERMKERGKDGKRERGVCLYIRLNDRTICSKCSQMSGHTFQSQNKTLYEKYMLLM